MTHFEEVIKKYLDQEAERDSAFKEKYEAKDKNITDCCNYIVSEVKRLNRNGFSDDEIYYMARHYYNEPNESLKIDSKQSSCRVVTNEASDEIEEEEIKPTREAKKPKAKVAPTPKEPAQEQLSIFDLGVEL